MVHKVMGFVDGENLVFRYQAMCKEGAVPKANVIHVPDVVVWHPSITENMYGEFVRISFYQTVVGAEERINEAKQAICDIEYAFEGSETSRDEPYYCGNLVPRVFKKENKNSKTKSVDINLTVDMLRHAINGPIDVLFLLSGDGDYLPLVDEASRHGKQVWLAAFSNGFNKNLRFAVDEFFCLDKYFFESQA